MSDAIARAAHAYEQLASGDAVFDAVAPALRKAANDLLAQRWRADLVVLDGVQHAHLTHNDVADPVALGLAYVLCGDDPQEAPGMVDHVTLPFPSQIGSTPCARCTSLITE